LQISMKEFLSRLSNRRNSKIRIFIATLLVYIFFYFFLFKSSSYAADHTPQLWEIRSIDTMKFSRDLAREKANDKSFDQEIEDEVGKIKELGANYIAISTPYDDEFYPYLKRWVEFSRKSGLSIWFRGNWSGWEGWFNYPKTLARIEHIQKTRNFILQHPELFVDGDSFTACPECEYGGPGNPMDTHDYEGFRKFMIDEYREMNQAFIAIGKKVRVNWLSLNPDVAKSILDEGTVKTLDNLITLDYYVKEVTQLEKGLDNIKNKFSEARFLIGEFGAPIPDINGAMTDTEQAQFIRNILNYLGSRKDVIGINYWVLKGGSTSLINPDGSSRTAVEVIKNYYMPGIVKGTVINTINEQLKGIAVKTKDGLSTVTDDQGKYNLAVPAGPLELTIEADRYKSAKRDIKVSRGSENVLDIVLDPQNMSLWYRIRSAFQNPRNLYHR